MPEMKSPDGTETLTVPDSGVSSLNALGWTIVGQRATSADTEAPPKRGPGRPRKNPEG